jgi:formylglycine-generating enzyme required for sulfatase activity
MQASLSAVVTFDWATVGNPGNGPDDTGFGAVSNVYRISKHEVTNAQYTEFLNAVDPTGANALPLYNSLMSSNANGGINFNSGAANGSKYQLKPGRDNNPVIYVSFFDAMRFTNWLENGQGTGSTESGVYTIGNGLNEIRNPSAAYFIPSEDEWYKAAYHKNNGVTGGATNYFDYPTSTDAVPYSDQPPGSGAPTQSNTANFFRNDYIANGYNDGYAVTGSTCFSGTQNYLTDVGAYTASLSPYGTFDQGGNVWEWNEAVISSSFRGLRGGNWLNGGLVAAGRFNVDPALEFLNVGFRVASIPEPRTWLLGVLGMLALMQRRRRSS